MNDYILEMNNICKTFPGVKALDDVTLKVSKGTIHALLGENGAGKSTLMKVLLGMYKQDSGKVIFDGKPMQNTNMNYILHQGISMIYQELNPIPHMTVAENIFIGREQKHKISGLLDKKQMMKDTVSLFKEVGIENIDPKTKLKDLTVAKAQMVEIAKAISYNSKLIIMDEPTSSLSEKECKHLFNITKRLKEKGVTFIFITHRLKEVFEIADIATVLRDGKFIGTKLISELDENSIITMMVGRELTKIFPKIDSDGINNEIALSVKNVTRDGEFYDVSFDAYKGEILGVAGLIGAGRTEAMETIFGYRELKSGSIYIDGKKVNIKTPRDAIKRGLALLTEDRKGTGLYMPLSIKDNIIMPMIKRYKKGPLINWKKITKVCAEQKTKFNIKTPSLTQTVNKLSGGNQQKVLVSRWLLTEPDIIIMDEPTRGIDVGAKAEIYQLIVNLAASGKCVIMVSSELPEIIGLSNRILVMHEGRVKGILDAKEATQDKILSVATSTIESNKFGGELYAN